MKGVGSGHYKAHNLKYQFVTLLRSILQKNQSKKDLHFVLLTDPKSVPYLAKILQKFIWRDTGKSPIKVTYDFVDTLSITKKYIKAISEIRPLFTSFAKEAKKYTDDLFLMGPFYHRVFPYEKMIFLDADLKFRIDVSELHDLFQDFDSKQVIGVAVDLAAHYRIAFRHFRKQNPDTKVGEPGRLQGFNTGVALYHLENMRQSQLYNKYVNPVDGFEAVKSLADKYQYSSHLGDQVSVPQKSNIH